MSYANNNAWREIQNFLPPAYRMTDADLPAEEWWDHRGHRIHLDTYRNPEAAVKVILLHGVGTNGRQLNLILGRPLARRGFETIAIDMPTYGVTEVAPGALVTFDDWVRIGAELVDRERARDDRPIVLYGLSAGGAEAYHIAARNRAVAGVIGMTFLDQRDPAVARATASHPLIGRGTPLLPILARTPLRRVPVPMRIASKMHTLVNDPAALRVFLRDRTSAGNTATVAFLASYMSFRPAVEPADFDTCPILLTAPAADRWTPEELSEPLLGPITRVPVRRIRLDGAGHFPLEQPGLDQLVDAAAAFAGGLGRG